MGNPIFLFVIYQPNATISIPAHILSWVTNPKNKSKYVLL